MNIFLENLGTMGPVIHDLIVTLNDNPRGGLLLALLLAIAFVGWRWLK